MAGKENYGIVTRGILWFAFFVNVFLFLIVIYTNSYILLSACLIISLLIIMAGNSYKSYYGTVPLTQSFYFPSSYFKSIISRKRLHKDRIRKESIKFSVNPENPYEYLIHSIKPVSVKDLSTTIGGRQNLQLYTTSVFHMDISDHYLSFDKIISDSYDSSYSGVVLHSSPKKSLFSYCNTNIILKFPINRTYDTYSSVNTSFEKLFSQPSVKGIELYLEINDKRNLTINDYVYKNTNEYFHSIPALLNFVERFREFVKGKPIGIRISVRTENEFTELCKEMKRRNIFLDFISIVGDTIFETNINQKSIKRLESAISFASKTIKKFKLENDVKIIAIGNIENGFELLKLLSLGADSCTGIIPASILPDSMQQFNTKTFNLINKRLLHFHNSIIREATGLMGYAGFQKLKDIDPRAFFQKEQNGTFKNFEEIYFQDANDDINELIKKIMHN